MIRFRPEPAIEDGLLLGLPEVDALDHRGSQLVVTGHGNVVHAVTATLATNSVIAHDLRVSQSTLEDAYLSITGGSPDLDGNGSEVTP